MSSQTAIEEPPCPIAAPVEAVGEVFGEPGALVGVVRGEARLFAPAAPRTVHIVEGSSPNGFVVTHARVFTCFAGDDEEIAAALPLARRSPLGHMQRPPLDGPVDRRAPPPLPVESTTHFAR